jgi:hypothetical protein
MAVLPNYLKESLTANPDPLIELRCAWTWHIVKYCGIGIGSDAQPTAEIVMDFIEGE